MASASFPGSRGARILRAYAGSRPLYDAAELEGASHHDESREISRAHHVIDHGARDGVGGLWSIVGGKLTTYRLMARDVVDAVARSLGIDAPCRTGRRAAARAGRQHARTGSVIGSRRTRRPAAATRSSSASASS